MSDVRAPHARLGRRHRNRVFCWWPHCDGLLGMVKPQPERGWAAGPDGVNTPDGPMIRYFWLAPGWHQSPVRGIWYLTPHARERIRRGRSPGFRRPDEPYIQAEWDDELPGPQWARTPDLPAVLKCPLCERFSTVDPAALNVDPATDRKPFAIRIPWPGAVVTRGTDDVRPL